MGIAATAASLQLSLHGLVPFPIPSLQPCLTALHLQQTRFSDRDVQCLALHTMPRLSNLTLHDCTLSVSGPSMDSNIGNVLPSAAVTRLECLGCWPEGGALDVLLRLLPGLAGQLHTLVCDDIAAVKFTGSMSQLTQLQLLQRYRQGQGARLNILTTADIQQLMAHPRLSMLTLPDMAMPEDTQLNLDAQACSWRELHLTGQVAWEWLARLPIPQLSQLHIDGQLHLARSQEAAATGLTRLRTCPDVHFVPKPNWRVPHTRYQLQPVFVIHGHADQRTAAVQHSMEVIQLVTEHLQGGLCLSHVYMTADLCETLTSLPPSVQTLCIDPCRMCPTITWAQISRHLPCTIKLLVMHETFVPLQQALSLLRAVRHELRVIVVGDCNVPGWKDQLRVAAASNSNVMLRVQTMFS